MTAWSLECTPSIRTSVMTRSGTWSRMRWSASIPSLAAHSVARSLLEAADHLLDHAIIVGEHYFGHQGMSAVSFESIASAGSWRV
jgi:hypothetical protein